MVGGESEFSDLAIRDVVADEYGFIRNQVDVQVTLATQSLSAQQVPVTITLGGEVAAKEAGKARDEGKEYVVHDGDVMLFKFNT